MPCVAEKEGRAYVGIAYRSGSSASQSVAIRFPLGQTRPPGLRAGVSSRGSGPVSFEGVSSLR